MFLIFLAQLVGLSTTKLVLFEHNEDLRLTNRIPSRMCAIFSFSRIIQAPIPCDFFHYIGPFSLHRA